MITEPAEIERESMRIIQEAIDRCSGSVEEETSLPAPLLLRRGVSDENLPVIKRVIHATADFDFLHTLHFSDGVVTKAREALRNHTPIITDTLMLASGISKNYGLDIICRISDDDVRTEAKARQTTRAVINIERCVSEYPEAVYAIGNAPTGLIRLCELIREGKARPALVIGAPVGFVNVLEAKDMLASLTGIPRIIAAGNKGGTTVACAIVNALLYGL